MSLEPAHLLERLIIDKVGCIFGNLQLTLLYMLAELPVEGRIVRIGKMTQQGRRLVCKRGKYARLMQKKRGEAYIVNRDQGI